MKKYLLIAIMACILCSCGTTGKEQSNEAESTLSPSEEAAVVEEITNEIDEQMKDVQKVTEESLQEIDSLLENI